mgnify:FL=1
MSELVKYGVVGTIDIFEDDVQIRSVTNAIHPQNFSRILARSLSNEQNRSIYRIAFGNGGTTVNAAGAVTIKSPNIGTGMATWDSRLYNEIYSEVVDPTSQNLGRDVGSADVNTGIRPGGGSVPSNDPTSIPHVSGPGVLSSESNSRSSVVITSVINELEPTASYLRDVVGTTSFTFDEIGLYTPGLPAVATAGYHAFNVGGKTTSSDTKLIRGQTYSFDVSVDDSPTSRVIFVVPASGGSGSAGEVLYGDLCDAINLGKTSWGLLGVSPLPGSAVIQITDDTDGVFATTAGAQTHGTLKITSGSVGGSSSVSLLGVNTTAFISQLNAPAGCTLAAAVRGQSAGVQNAPLAPATERERLLTHATFAPITKVPGRRYTLRYTLSIE